MQMKIWLYSGYAYFTKQVVLQPAWRSMQSKNHIWNGDQSRLEKNEKDFYCFTYSQKDYKQGERKKKEKKGETL